MCDCIRLFPFEYNGLQLHASFLLIFSHIHRAEFNTAFYLTVTLFAWAKSLRNIAPKSKLGKAVNYLIEEEPYLRRYIEDGRLEIDNNRAERSMKPFVIGRKNWLFANTPSGAKASATAFSIIETAKENGVDPYEYLKYVFTKAPNLKNNKSIDILLPWNAPDDCRSKSVPSTE